MMVGRLLLVLVVMTCAAIAAAPLTLILHVLVDAAR